MTRSADSAATETSRRTLLRAAAVGTGLVWTAPVVQAFAPAAFAAGTPAPGPGIGISYIAVLLRSAGGMLYRLKFEADGSPGPRVPEVGDTFATPVCGTWPSPAQPAGGSNWQTVVRAASTGFFSEGVFTLALVSGVELVDFVIKQGDECCLTAAGAESSGYPVRRTAGQVDYTFPGIPNKRPCTMVSGGAAPAAGSATSGGSTTSSPSATPKPKDGQ